MAVGFKLVTDQFSASQYRNVRVASQAYTIGDLVMIDFVADAVDVVPATSSCKTTNVYGVAMETVLSTATSLLIALVNPYQTWSADTTNNTVVNDAYERMVIGANAHTVNNTHTDDTSVNAVFQQIGVVGALTDKRIVGRFLTAAVAA
jgi:hypothetical protein